MILKKSIVLFVCLFISILSFSYTQKSIQKWLYEIDHGDDTTRLAAYLESANHYLDINKDSAKLFINQGLNFGNEELIKKISDEKKLKLKSSIAQLYELEGYYYLKKNIPKEAIKSFDRAATLFEEVKNKEGIAQNYNNLAVVYRNIGNPTASIKYNQDALKLFEEVKNKEGEATVLNNLSVIFRDQGDIENALKYTKKALKINKEVNNVQGEAKTLNILAGLNKIQGDTLTALIRYEKALSIYRETSNSAGEARILNNIGVIYKNRKAYEKALELFDSSYKLSNDIGFTIGKGYALVNMSEVYNAKKIYSLAIENGEKALEIGEKTNNIDLLKRGSEVLFSTYKKQNNWKKAFAYQTQYLEAIQKISNAETKELALKEAIRYSYEKEQALEKKELERKKALDLERAEKQELITYITIGFAVFLVLIIFFIIHRLKLSNEQRKLIQRQSGERKLLLQEIHHRVKNNFQIVSSLLRLQSHTLKRPEVKEAFEEAISRINTMSLVHEIIYRQESFAQIDTEEYLSKLCEQLKMSSKNQEVEINISTSNISFEVATLIHIGIVINELILNSFKYGFDMESHSPQIQISVRAIEEEKYELIYKENGKGIDPDHYKASFGMELIETVIDQLEGKVEVASEEYWKTKITITFIEEKQTN